MVSFHYYHQCGADDYEEYPNAAAAIDPPCKETEEMFNCDKLTKLTIFYPQGEKWSAHHCQELVCEY